ncbi:hypothetical protein CI238_10066, partial [Colletotrichum incanum]
LWKEKGNIEEHQKEGSTCFFAAVFDWKQRCVKGLSGPANHNSFPQDSVVDITDAVELPAPTHHRPLASSGVVISSVTTA